jgi:hypothetical protein
MKQEIQEMKEDLTTVAGERVRSMEEVMIANYLFMNGINYEYEKDRPTGFKAPAEELITDKYSLNKKGTKLNRITGKFRRNTVERFESIIEELQ